MKVVDCLRFTHACVLLYLLRSVINDLIGEAAATKNAIDEANEGVESSIEASNAVPVASSGFDGDLFGFDAAANAPLPSMQAAAPAPAPMDVPAPVVVQSVSFDSGDPQTQSKSIASVDSYPTQQPVIAMAAPAQTTYDYSAPAPAAPMDMYGTSATHQRTASAVSVGFDSEAIMGGAPGPLPSPSTFDAPQGPAASVGTYGASDSDPTPTVENVAELKRKAKEAEDLARDAEESRRQVMAQVDELRRVADEAESNSRKALEEGDGKRKGFRGRGKKKEAVSCIVCACWMPRLCSN